jgi:hypothetical protein
VGRAYFHQGARKSPNRRHHRDGSKLEAQVLGLKLAMMFGALCAAWLAVVLSGLEQRQRGAGGVDTLRAVGWFIPPVIGFLALGR